MENTELLKFLLPPIIGAVIGLFTNYMAIKMLFRPFNPVKFLGMRLPFTPGVIPKEHEKLAIKIGETVGTHLVTPDSLHELFKAEAVKTKIKDALDGMYEKFGMLAAFITPEVKDMIAVQVLEMLDSELPNILEELDIQAIVTQKVKDFSLEKLEEIILSVTKTQLAYITYFGGILGFIIGSVQVLIMNYL